jgi:5-methylcytosine-specific restriction endonuclease McrA
MTLDWQARYRAVLVSARWRRLRLRLLRLRGIRCQHCGSTWAPGYKHSLQLHHRTYERLGDERDEDDVELLCAGCHEDADRERARQGQQRAEAALEQARFDGWMRRRYGSDWELLDRDTIEDEEERFDAFLRDD